MVCQIRVLAASVGELLFPALLTTAPPEGFSYYALHPLDFARTAEQIADSSCPVAVLGVRSIGTTLSEVVTAVLEMVTHGDDHFFPGPCDIAWDLAGTAVEWDCIQIGRITYSVAFVN